MMYRLLLMAALAALLLAPHPARAQTVRVEIMRAQVKCVTVTRNGALETTCSIKGLQRIAPNEIPAPARKFELPGGDFKVPPPLTEADLSPSGELPGEEPAVPPKRKAPSCAQAETEPEDPESDHEPDDDPPPARPAPKMRAPRVAPPEGTRRVRLYAGEVQVLDLLNNERARRGLSPVRLDVEAIRAARAHSKDMCERSYFAHTSPEGKKPWDRLRAAGARFRAAGEDIAKGYLSARSVHDGWLSSPGHRDNRLNPIYTRVGIGLHLCGGKVPYWTELFMK